MMATTTVFSDQSDAELTSFDSWGAPGDEDPGYGSTEAGPGEVDSSSNNGYIGQYHDATSRSIHQCAFPFDTSSVPSGDDVNSSLFSLYLELTDFSQEGEFTIETYSYDWGSSIQGSDWRTTSDLSGMTIIAEYDGTANGWTVDTYHDFSEVSSGLSNAINKSGTTKLWCVSSEQGSDSWNRAMFSHADRSGTTQDPKLVIEHITPNTTPTVSLDSPSDTATVNTDTPTLTALVSDPDSGQTLTVDFEVYGIDYIDEVLNDSPIAYWRLGESSGTTAVDETGNGHDGTYNGSPTLGEPGLIASDSDTAVGFDELDDYIEVSSDPALEFGTSDFTLEAWVQYDATTTSHQVIYSHRQDYVGPGQPGYDFLITQDTGNLRIVIEDTDSINAYDSDSAVPTGEPVHVVAVFDRDGNVTFYQNGSADGSFDISGESGDISNNRALRIGAMEDDTGTLVDNFGGTLDELAIYNSALSTARIQAHYAASSPVDVGTDTLASPASNASSAYTTNSLSSGTYLWRARVSDGVETSAWTSAREFTFSIGIEGSLISPQVTLDGSITSTIGSSGSITSSPSTVAASVGVIISSSGNVISPTVGVDSSVSVIASANGTLVPPTSVVDGSIGVSISANGEVLSPASIISGGISTSFSKITVDDFGDGNKRGFGTNGDLVTITNIGTYNHTRLGSSFSSSSINTVSDYSSAKFGSALSNIAIDFSESVTTSRNGGSIGIVAVVGIHSGHKHFSDAAIVNVVIHVLQDGGFVVTGNAITTLTIGSFATGLKWWKPSWLYRRTVQIYAMDKASLPIGHPITIEFDSDFVSTGRVRSDMHDLWVLYGGNPIVSEAEVKDGRTFVYFYAQETIPAGESRPYSVYYGNPNSADEFTSTIEIPQA